jgi:hypothetical protein
MRPLFGKQLRAYLSREVLGKAPERKPPIRARTGERRGPARDPDYRAWIRSLPCAACGCERGIEAAHTGSDGGTSMKASDYSCIPLCGACHRTGLSAYHRTGRAAFEAHWGLCCAALVRRLNAAWMRMAG